MPLSTPTLLATASNYYSGPYQTGSFSAGGAGRLLVVLCAVGANGENDAGDLADAVSLSGGGLTWTKVASANHDLSWDELAVCAFWAISDGTGSMTVAPSVSGSRTLYKFYAQVYEFAADFNTSSPIGAVYANASASASDPDATLSPTTDASSCILGAAFCEGGGSATPGTAPSGWTELYENAGLHWGMYDFGAYSTVPFTGVDWDYIGGIVAVEVVEDAGGAPIEVDGALSAQAASISGDVEVIANFTGALAAQAASISGAVRPIVNATGALASQASAIAGVITATTRFNGALAAQAAAISSAVRPIISATGALAAQASAISGDVEAIVNATGALAAQAASTSGAIATGIPFTGTLQAQSASITGVFTRRLNATGALVSAGASISSTVFSEPALQFESIMLAGSASVSGSFSRSKFDRSDVIRIVQRGRFKFKVRAR